MPSYTKQQVIDERKCGLKFFDRAVAKVGIEKILEETVRIAKEFPDTWGRGWRNVDWAFGNAWRNVINYDGQANENLDEALTPEQHQWLADQLGHRMEDYTPCWERRPPGKEVKKRPPKPEGTLSSKELKKLLEALLDSALKDPDSDLHRTIKEDGHLDVEVLPKKMWHRAAAWGRDSKKKDACKNNVRVFNALYYEATVTSDPTDTKVLEVTVQVGPAWPEADRPKPVKMTLP